jgi:DNA repair protein RadC
MDLKYSPSRKKDLVNHLMNNNIVLHYSGHRIRIKERFLKSQKGSFSELELLEMMLFWSIPRKDVKPTAKLLMSSFGSIAGIVNAGYDKLSSHKDIAKNTIINMILIKEVLDRILQREIMQKNILSSWSSLIDYLKVSMGSSKTEEFRILFLNKKIILIADEIQPYGTVDQTPIYPREVVKRALFHEASALILVHNHPSGNPDPSSADINVTKQIIEACRTVNISIHDHIIVTSSEIYSFKSNLLL